MKAVRFHFICANFGCDVGITKNGMAKGDLWKRKEKRKGMENEEEKKLEIQSIF